MTEQITMLYDNHCEFCVVFSLWLRRQPMYVPIVFRPIHAEETAKRFPELTDKLAAGEFIVLDDSGGVYSETNARLLILWALREYRELSYTLAKPAFLPYVHRVFDYFSTRRSSLKQLTYFFRKLQNGTTPARSVRKSICESGQCF